MSFIQVLESEHYHLVESIEHGSSDAEIIKNLKAELYRKTGFKYKTGSYTAEDLIFS